ncbi:MAG: hypothetical protein FJ403_16360 [Verrucomicrobia bacterium]|nr:hypothetical protein [Verrucomicrobiota bacterium]
MTPLRSVAALQTWRQFRAPANRNNDGRELFTVKPNANVRSSGTVVGLSPDSQRIVLSAGRTVKVWRRNSREELLTLKGHSQGVFSVTFSADGKRIVTGTSDYLAKVLDAISGEEISTFEGHGSTVFSATFSPDGQRDFTRSVSSRSWQSFLFVSFVFFVVTTAVSRFTHGSVRTADHVANVEIIRGDGSRDSGQPSAGNGSRDSLCAVHGGRPGSGRVHHGLHDSESVSASARRRSTDGRVHSDLQGETNYGR